MRIRGVRTGLLLLAGLVALTAPGEARADWPSTTTVECLAPNGTACTGLRFFVDALGSNRLTGLSIFNKNLSAFNFGQVLSLTDRNGVAVNWVSAIVDVSQFSIEFFVGAGHAALEPLYLTLSLTSQSTGTAAQAGNGSFTYAAVGYQGTTGYNVITTGGNVTGAVTTQPPVTATPEPVTMALLGTGLLGIGAARRRRNNRRAPEDATA